MCWGAPQELLSYGLPELSTPTLLLVGRRPRRAVRHLKRQMRRNLRGPFDLVVVPRLPDLYHDAAVQQQVAARSIQWLTRYFAADVPPRAGAE